MGSGLASPEKVVRSLPNAARVGLPVVFTLSLPCSHRLRAGLMAGL